jgi:hypothetical protein
MYKLISILLVAFLTICSGDLLAQKNNGLSPTTPQKGGGFSKKSKGPNVKTTSRGPRTKNRSKLYQHQMSKKRGRVNKSYKEFSATKGRYKGTTKNGKGASGGSEGKGRKSDKSGRSGRGRKK